MGLRVFIDRRGGNRSGNEVNKTCILPHKLREGNSEEMLIEQSDFLFNRL